MIVDPNLASTQLAGPPRGEATAPEWVVRSVAVDDAVTVSDHVVVYRDGAVHVLNPIAALIWRSCDAPVPVSTLANELAASFAVDHAAVLADVVATVGDLVGSGLVERVRANDDGPSSPESAIPILTPLAACSGCGEGPSYDCHVTVDLGDVGVSIGADTEVAEALAAALGSRVLSRETAPVGRASYGIVIPSGARGRAPVALARLHRGPDVLLTSRDPRRVLRAALAQIVTHRAGAADLLLEGIVVGRDGQAVVVPLPANRVAFERAAAEFGLGVSDASMAMVQLQPPQITVGAPGLDVDFGPLEGLGASRRHLTEPARLLPWGSHDLVAVAVNGAPNAASVIGELGPRLGSNPAGGTPVAPLLVLCELVRVAHGPGPAEIDRLLRST